MQRRRRVAKVDAHRGQHGLDGRRGDVHLAALPVHVVRHDVVRARQVDEVRGEGHALILGTPGPRVGRVSELSDPDDRKLVTLARATRARTGAAEGAALRDADSRTYAAATVDLPSLRVSAIGVAVAMAVASGSHGVEAVVVLTEATAVAGTTSLRCATSRVPACPASR